MKEEYWLSLALCARQGTIAIHRRSDKTLPICLEERCVDEGSNYCEKLVGVIESLTHQLNIGPRQIDRLLTTAGPGSFTGLRVAFAFLKAYAFATDCPIETVHSAEVRALGWLNKEKSPNDALRRLHVVTTITSDKCVVSSFERLERHRLALFNEQTLAVKEGPSFGTFEGELWLLDGAISSLKPKWVGANAVCALHAADLGGRLHEASTRQTSTTVKEWIELSPRYEI